MLLIRLGKVVVALAFAGALFAAGFALGSDGHGERPGPKRTSAREGDAPAIDSLNRAESIPSLREREGDGGASPTADTGAGASGGSPAGSGAGSTTGTEAGSTTGSPAVPPPKPPPSKPAPVRRNSTE